MAILGAQLVFSMVFASMLSKLSGSLSLARWLLCGHLVKYLHPSDDELRTAAGIPIPHQSKRSKKADVKRKANAQKGDGKDSFLVPKNIDIQLESSQIQPLEVIQLHYYAEFQWLVDFAVCSIIIYSLTELYYALILPQQEFNLSMLWCLLVAGFAVKIMYSLTAMYFRLEEGGERILCIVFCIFFLFMAMVILIIDENTLEFGLQPAYWNFSKEAKDFLDGQGIESQGPASLITFKIVLAIFAAILGTFLTFPGLRLAKMHSDAVKYADGRPFLLLLLNLNMIMPLLIALMWLKPAVRDFVVTSSGNTYADRYRLEPDTFEIVRVAVILSFCMLRVLLLWPHLQSHLNSAIDRLHELKKESGRISSAELQRIVARVFYYLCVIALQYIAPLILLMSCTLMLKTMAGFSWSSLTKYEIPALVTPRNITSPTATASASSDPDSTAATILDTASQFSVALSSLRQVFTPICFKGVLSFLCWWICTCWFTTSAFGMVYYSYFTN